MPPIMGETVPKQTHSQLNNVRLIDKNEPFTVCEVGLTREQT